MCTYWYDEKCFIQKYMIELYAAERNKRRTLCLSREKDVRGNRYFYIVNVHKFVSFYPSDPLKHFCEIITDKCALYFDIEYSKQKEYIVNVDEAFDVFINLVVRFILKENPGFSRRNIFYFTADSSNDIKFSRHVIFRIIKDEVEYMFINNFEHCQQFVFAFREYMISQIFKPSSSNDANFDLSNVPLDCSSLKKYTVGLDQKIQETQFQEYFDLYHKHQEMSAGIVLMNALFIDWAVYDRNRHLRIVGSSKKCDPKRVLKYVPQCSELPHEAASKDEIFRFSLLSKPYLNKVAV
ncbi:hypothetical protein TKK_0009891 [Trichogramma kaykai]